MKEPPTPLTGDRGVTLFERIRAISPSILDNRLFSTMPKIAFSFRLNVLHDWLTVTIQTEAFKSLGRVAFKRISVILCLLIWNSDQNTAFFSLPCFVLLHLAHHFRLSRSFRSLVLAVSKLTPLPDSCQIQLVLQPLRSHQKWLAGLCCSVRGFQEL